MSFMRGDGKDLIIGTVVRAVVLGLGIIGFLGLAFDIAWIGSGVLACALIALVVLLMWQQWGLNKQAIERARSNKIIGRLEGDLAESEQALDDLRFIAQIQSPKLNTSLEGFLQSVLGDLADKLDVYQLSLFMKNNDGDLCPKAMIRREPQQETYFFFADEVPLMSAATGGATQVFRRTEQGLEVTHDEAPVEGGLVTLPVVLDESSVSVDARGDVAANYYGILKAEATGLRVGSVRVEYYADVADGVARDRMREQSAGIELDMSHVYDVVERHQHVVERISDSQGDKVLSFTYALNVLSERRGEEAEHIFGALKMWQRLATAGEGTALMEGPNDERKRLEKFMEASKFSIAQAIRKEQAYIKSITDPLTTLFTKRHFITNVTDAFNAAKRYRESVTLVLVDIDHFKRFNDTYGHLTGDKVLREVALHIKQGVRETDFAFRYGGEELVMLLRHTKVDEGLKMAERVRNIIADTPFETLEPKKELTSITVSMGLAQVKPEMEKIDDLIEAADQALYASKENGRNRVTVA